MKEFTGLDQDMIEGMNTAVQRLRETTFEDNAENPGRDDRGGEVASERVTQAGRKRLYRLRAFDYRAVELVREFAAALERGVCSGQKMTSEGVSEWRSFEEVFFPPGGRNREGPG
jgi:hypothetical protein